MGSALWREQSEEMCRKAEGEGAGELLYLTVIGASAPVARHYLARDWLQALTASSEYFLPSLNDTARSLKRQGSPNLQVMSLREIN